MLMQFLAHPSMLLGLFTAPPSNYIFSRSKCQSQDNMPICSFILDHSEQTASDSKERIHIALVIVYRTDKEPLKEY